MWNLVHRVGTRVRLHAPALGARIALASAKRISEPELHLVRDLIKPGRLSLDIGANWGMYTGELLRCGSRVVAFEPNPNEAARLARAFPRATVERCALSDHEGTATLRMPRLSNGDASTGRGTITQHALPLEQEITIEVPVRTLDSFGFTGIGFVKIDADYHEMSVLDGGWETIRREKPNMLIEAEDDIPEKLAERLAAIGYACTFYLDGQERPFAEWHRGLRAWHGAPPNNFLFRA